MIYGVQNNIYFDVCTLPWTNCLHIHKAFYHIIYLGPWFPQQSLSVVPQFLSCTSQQQHLFDLQAETSQQLELVKDCLICNYLVVVLSLFNSLLFLLAFCCFFGRRSINCNLFSRRFLTSRQDSVKGQSESVSMSQTELNVCLYCCWFVALMSFLKGTYIK